MKKQILRHALLALCGGALTLTACVDKDYDLNNLDTTMKIGDGTLMLPTSSTEDIQMDNLFTLDEGGAVVKSPDGTYYLHKGGASTEQTIHIEDIAIPSPEIKAFSATLNGQEPAAATKASMPKKAPGAETYIWEYPFEEKTTLSYDNENSNDINADIMSIDNIKFGNDQRVSFTITVSNYGTILKNLRFGTLRIELPLGFDITEATYNNQYNDVITKEPQVLSDKQVLLFETKPLALAYTQQAVIELKLKGAYMGNNGCFSFEPGATPMIDKGRVKMLKSEIKILGDLHVAEGDIDLANIDYSTLTPAEIAQIGLGDYTPILPKHIKFDGQGEFHNSIAADTKLHVSLFTGSIHHAIDQIDDIQLNNLPDFLTEDDVKLDLSAPQLFLKVSTNLPVAANIRGLKITSYPKNGKEPALIAIGSETQPVTFVQSEAGYVVPLVKDKNNLEKPEEYAACTYGDAIEVTNLEQLLVNVPDHITIAGNGADGKLVVELDNCVDLPVNADYKVQFDYLAHCKLTFGPNFQLVYRSDETGIDLGSDLDKLDFEALIIEAQVNTTIPLEILLEATPIDKNGNVVNGLAIIKQIRNGATYKEVNPLTIRAKADGTKDTDKIRLLVKATKGDINNYLKEGPNQFDGLKLKASLVNNDPANIEALKANSYIKLTNVRIGVEGGVTILDKE